MNNWSNIIILTTPIASCNQCSLQLQHLSHLITCTEYQSNTISQLQQSKSKSNVHIIVPVMKMCISLPVPSSSLSWYALPLAIHKMPHQPIPNRDTTIR